MKSNTYDQTRNIVSDATGSRPTYLIGEDSLAIRPPRAEDAAALRELVRGARTLDPNSTYAYLLLCTDFADTAAVAEIDGGIAGCVLGYRPPARPEVYFVWQVAVSDEHRGCGLAAALLGHVLERELPRGVTFLEATVTPSNEASQSLFRGFARRAGVGFSEQLAFPAHLFPEGDHEEEVRVRIGPLDREALRRQRS